MKGDFTRFSFDASRHFSRVLQQQGRVALDADANEATAILLHHLRTLTRDLVGACGGPADSGFALVLDTGANQPVLRIGPGHYYVDGILCENDAWVDYAQQPDFAPAPPDAGGAGGDALLAWLRSPTDGQRFWIHLDVWERHISWIEDERIREAALGGPDTCTRAKVVWQVKAWPWDPSWGDAGGADACAAPLAASVGSTARLAARVDPGPADTDPCVIAPSARYRGPENQLYRVEIQAGGGAGSASFKWSRDNGSVATRWLGVDGDALIVTSTRGFEAGDWLELGHDALDLAGQPGPLLRVATVDADRLTIDGASLPAGGLMAWSAQLGHPKVRRWDQRANDSVQLVAGAVPVVESTAAQVNWIDLEDGVQVAFSAGGDYRSGDYWVIPARVASGSIEWPQAGGQPRPEPPRGIVHHIAPLGVLVSSDGWRLTPCRNCIGPSSVACLVPAAPAGATPAADAPKPTGPATKAAKGKR